jgi:hypothetical protein
VFFEDSLASFRGAGIWKKAMDLLQREEYSCGVYLVFGEVGQYFIRT